MASKSPVKGKSKLSELPLLDEVNELIEKERLLLTLKVLEQQREAQDWKARYDVLVGKVSETSLRTGDFRAMEVLAATTLDPTADSKSGLPSVVAAPPPTAGGSAAASSIPATTEGVQNLLAGLKHDWIMDLSSTVVKSPLLNQLNNDALNLRAPTKVKIAKLSGCYMTDECASALGAMVSRPAIEAMDLSFNDLTSSTTQQINAGLRTRRRTPQYLLLHGNPALSSAASSLTSTLALLTDSTWGISVSVQDLAHGQLSGGGGAGGASALKKRPGAKETGTGAKAGSKSSASGSGRSSSAITDLYDASNHPMRALDFLTQLHLTLDPSVAEGKGKGKAPAKKPAAKKDSKEDKADKEEKGGVLRSSKITALAVLGLTHNHLSMQSVAQLSVLLPVLAPTLTDLDLSFSYIGLHGASHLAKALQHRRCSLVRLGLSGNNLGDLGLSALTKGLRTNNTLTSLDLRSNNISQVGLRSLCAGLAVSPRCCLSRIDVRCNPIPHNDMLGAVASLRQVGSSVHLLHGPSLPGDCSLTAGVASALASTSTSPAASLPPYSQLLWQQPFASACNLDVSIIVPTASIYSIDLRHANAHYSKHPGHPLAVEWSMRPLLAQSSASAGAGAPASTVPLKWEVRLFTPTTDKVLASGVLAPTACIGGSWARVRAIVSELPGKGSLEITARPALSPDAAAAAGLILPTAVECCQGLLYSISPDEALVVGSDCRQWSDAENSVVSLASARAGAFAYNSATGDDGLKVPSGYKVLRTLKVTETGSAVTNISWESKLHAAGPAMGQQGRAAFGYEWIVLLSRCQQQPASASAAAAACQVLARGTCFSTDEEPGYVSTTAVLKPWVWTKQETRVDLGGGDGEEAVSVPLIGDSLVIAARPKSIYDGAVAAAGPAADDVFGQLEVLVRGAALGSQQRAAQPRLPDSSVLTTLFVAHNAAGLQW